jgi:hypothetical protein
MGGTAGEWRGISGEKRGDSTQSLARVGLGNYGLFWKTPDFMEIGGFA